MTTKPKKPMTVIQLIEHFSKTLGERRTARFRMTTESGVRIIFGLSIISTSDDPPVTYPGPTPKYRIN
jgi:hypothetical protein